MAEQSFEARLQTINRQTLAPLVGRALKTPTEIIDWQYETVHGGTGTLAGDGLCRFFGRGQTGAGSCEWSLILKIVRADSLLAGDVLSSSDYWKREALAYQSGVLDELPGRLAAPRCFGVQETSADELWIWLEEIPAETDRAWPLARYGLAAEHLGQFNGAYLTGRNLPSYEWLSSGRIHDWLAEAEEVIPRLHQFMAHPFARKWLTADSPDRMLRLWSGREALLDGIARLPRTLCHHDAFRRNLMSGRDQQGQEITYALDWSIMGTGVIGEEIATTFFISLEFLDQDAHFARPFDEAIYQGYLAGLRAAGWNDKAELVRFGYVASVALFGCLGATGSWLPWTVDDSNHEVFVQLMGQPLDKVADQWSKMQGYLLELADEAMDLLAYIR